MGTAEDAIKTALHGHRRGRGHLVALCRGPAARLILTEVAGKRRLRERVIAFPAPDDGDMYSSWRYVCGDRWGKVVGPVITWAARDPAITGAFIGPPVAIIYLED